MAQAPKLSIHALARIIADANDIESEHAYRVIRALIDLGLLPNSENFDYSKPWEIYG